MPKIYLDRDDRIICYGNPAGFVRGDDAVVDNLFHTEEMTAFLEKRQIIATWQDGIYDRLSSGAPMEEAVAESSARLKFVRIWQLKPNADIGLKFISYDEVCKRYGEPDPANYAAVWDGCLETNNLEEIYAKFNLNHPADFTGHSLSMSDVVELYNDSGSEFHYCDRCGFTEISFQPPQQTQQQNM
ncbi:YodL domain-containing protein [Oscillibacter sp.]|jgi:hypothetical protein|uniref:YodL domain-containing protein n=1 Tax=Oscillibacter sp. TaxID=1945593 RepID=UPI002898EC6E|nr:YodL domain-containing protein [Oscillibacter sp.]